MFRRPLALTATLAALALAASACGGSSDTGSTNAQGLTSVNYVTTATVPGSTQIALYAVPKQMGYFKEEGLEANLKTANGSSAALQVIASGDALATNAEVASTMAAVEQGVPVRTVGSINTSFPWKIGVPDGKGISSPADLKGKKIGVISLASGSNLFTRSFLHENGIDPDKDVKILPVGQGTQAKAALDSGQVDAIALYAELFSQLEQIGMKFSYLTNPALFDGMPSISFTVSAKTLQGKDKDLAVKYTRAAYKGLMFARLNPEAAVDMGLKTFPELAGSGGDTAKRRAELVTLLKAWMTTSTPQTDDPAAWPQWGELSDAQLKKAATWALSTGQVKKEPNVADVFDGSLIKDINAFDRDAVIKDAKDYKIAG
ncbi:ABC transporter substrate-binding protein [Dactylosporangium sp. CS-047395]|uniref:ABC transporter substrate-binding protein n=1 Tax=Dactylosporangium sp. CS-047395 TaxID=3239936 RepID=UPI003D8DC0C6